MYIARHGDILYFSVPSLRMTASDFCRLEWQDYNTRRRSFADTFSHFDNAQQWDRQTDRQNYDNSVATAVTGWQSCTTDVEDEVLLTVDRSGVIYRRARIDAVIRRSNVSDAQSTLSKRSYYSLARQQAAVHQTIYQYTVFFPTHSIYGNYTDSLTWKQRYFI